MSDELRQQKIAETREVAIDVLDDLRFIGEAIAKAEPTPGDIRRLSGLLRRLLLDNGGDLPKVAAPRLQRPLQFTAPNLLPISRLGQKHPYHFLAAGTAEVFGITVDVWAQEVGVRPRDIPGYHPDQTVSLKIDGFLRQQVLCLEGMWVTRRDVVDYVANVARGVHSGTVNSDARKLIHRVRRIAHITMRERTPSLFFNANLTGEESRPVAYDPQALDITLVLLMSSARYLLISPDVSELQSNIEEEIAGAAAANRR